MATISQTTPLSSNEVSNEQGELIPVNNDAKIVVGSPAKELGEDQKTQVREGYSIKYFCQPNSWQSPELAPTECLTKEEQTQLDNIVCKLLHSGVMLGIAFCTLQEVLCRQYEAKGQSAYPLTNLGTDEQNHEGNLQTPLR